jgi:hypothetical protein
MVTIRPLLISLLLSNADGFSITSGRATGRTVTQLAAQKMTPTRKTRRDDSFDRSSGDEEKVEKGEVLLEYLVYC